MSSDSRAFASDNPNFAKQMLRLVLAVLLLTLVAHPGGARGD
jgi:hypothetical protein